MANTEIQSYLLSDAFKETISNAVKEGVADALSTTIKPLEERIALLEEKAAKVDVLEKTIAQLPINCSDNEQYSRRQNLRVYGFTEEEGEDYIKKTVNMCKNKLGDIDKAHRHRVGKPRHGKPRTIVVKLEFYRLIKARKT